MNAAALKTQYKTWQDRKEQLLSTPIHLVHAT